MAVTYLTFISRSIYLAAALVPISFDGATCFLPIDGHRDMWSNAVIRRTRLWEQQI
jgi:hypothetical protein